jgi:hypothetical protein
MIEAINQSIDQSTIGRSSLRRMYLLYLCDDDFAQSRKYNAFALLWKTALYLHRGQSITLCVGSTGPVGGKSLREQKVVVSKNNRSMDVNAAGERPSKLPARPWRHIVLK